MHSIPHLRAILLGETLEAVISPGDWDWVDSLEAGAKRVLVWGKNLVVEF